jgi:Zn-dependent M28 family amino/carboxypeptidase
MDGRSALVAVVALAVACGGGDDDSGPAEPAPLPACDATSAAGLAGCASRERWAIDLATLAVPRPPGSAGWQAAQDLCADRFASAGFTVERQSYGTGVNVIGTRVGAAATPRVILSAHYDSVENCAGADDNASGVAGLLEAARVLGPASFGGTLVVACWDEEESGMIGSAAYAATASGPIDVAFVFEMIGYRSFVPGSQSLPTGFDVLFPQQTTALAQRGDPGDFIATIADPSAQASAAAYAASAPALSLPVMTLEVPESLLDSPLVADLRRSDHASFWSVGAPAIMVTDTAEFRNPHYHCTSGPDAPADLDSDFAARVVGATVSAAASRLGMP